MERHDHLYVHQVGAAQIGIVLDDYVTGPEIVSQLDDRLGRELHHAKKDR